MTYYLYPRRDSPESDAAPNVPTPDEILFAEEIRHRLEMQLLSRTEWPTREFGAVEYEWANRYEV